MGRAKQAVSKRGTSSASEIGQALAARIQAERKKRNWSIQELAEHSGISRAMISKVERGEASPTAVTLSCLGVAFGLSMSSLLEDEEKTQKRLIRAAEQHVWRDPETGYTRRAISPPAGMPLQLVEVCLPPKKKVGFPALSYSILHQQIWILEGELRFREGAEIHEMKPGDCLQLAGAADCVFENPSRSKNCRYVVAIIVGR